MSAIGVTAIVVAFNGGSVLERCLAALRATSYRSFDILIVDNGSSDGAVERLRESVEGGLRVLRLPTNAGFAAGVIAGIDYEEKRLPRNKDHIYALVNQDCFVDSGWLGPLVAALCADGNVAVAGGTLYEEGRRCLQHAGATILANGLTLHRGRGEWPAPVYAHVEDVDYVTGAMCAFRGETWRRLGGFDPAFFPVYFEEADFCLRARELGMRVVFEPASEGVHVEAMSSGGPGPAFLTNYHRNRMRFAARHLLKRGRRSAAVAAELRWLAVNRGRPLGAPLLRAYLCLPAELWAARRAPRPRVAPAPGTPS